LKKSFIVHAHKNNYSNPLESATAWREKMWPRFQL